MKVFSFFTQKTEKITLLLFFFYKMQTPTDNYMHLHLRRSYFLSMRTILEWYLIRPRNEKSLLLFANTTYKQRIVQLRVQTKIRVRARNGISLFRIRVAFTTTEVDIRVEG